MRLTEEEQNLLSRRVTGLESRTGAQVVAAVIGKSDSYPEAPWKAFALGVALVALYSAARSLIVYDWEAGESALAHAVVILGSGAVLALLAVLFEPFSRLFTDRRRRDLEVTQYAKALFFDRGLDRTRGRIGILLLVSLFERKVVILADDGFEARIDRDDWQRLTDRMTLLLGRGNAAGALHAGLEGLEALLLERGYRVDESTADELPNAVLQLKGER
ncbi:MAG TPA: TPM domain-containing protein [Burkholderiales bacterium]|jgi:putative membrane protein|nr:TPM domain-containing protein [Burkholderiales bacterium]